MLDMEEQGAIGNYEGYESQWNNGNNKVKFLAESLNLQSWGTLIKCVTSNILLGIKSHNYE